jgi:hypothetical protein
MKSKTLLGLLAAVLAFSVSSVAFGGPSYQGSLSMGYSRSSGGFAGNLSSHRGCVGGRKVVVYMKKGGRDRAVGNDKASAGGGWGVKPGKVKAGDYYAMTKSVTLNSGAKCAAVKSPSTHVS